MAAKQNEVLICIFFFSVLSVDLYFGFINMAIAFIIAYFFMAGGLWAVHNKVHENGYVFTTIVVPVHILLY